MSRLVITNNDYLDYVACKNNISTLKELNESLYNNFVNNGFIIEDYLNETEKYLKFYEERKKSKEFYHIIINPTMDCNLKYWYRYENHIEKSFMKEDYVIENFNNAIISNEANN